MSEIKIFGNSKNFELFKEVSLQLPNKKGAIIAINGEAGFGKTTLLNHFYQNILEKDIAITGITNCQAPIGNFKIGNFQPFLPFSRIAEQILSRKTKTVEKEFAYNIGMTVLSTIPIAGDLIFAVKELGKDIKQYKRDKSLGKYKQISKGVNEYFELFTQYSKKETLAIFIDDMHWSDSQSVELLHMLAEEIQNFPLLITFTYKQSELDKHSLPLISFIQKYKKGSEYIHCINLEPFDLNELTEIYRYYIPNYIPNKEFEEWMFEHSFGVPNVVIEYMRYFQRVSPFNSDGSLTENFGESEYLPVSVHSALSHDLDKLSEEEKNILAVCSAEGREFTALIVSSLLNTDILTAIQKLRNIQKKTSLIKSLGPQFRYGIKTTVYTFTQAFYHSFFENTLEYEEHVALHGRISALLKQRFEDEENESIRQQIAPYLAAHSFESGDNETAKTMLLIAAETAHQFGGNDIVRQAYDNFIMLNKQSENTDETSPINIAFKNILADASANKSIELTNSEVSQGISDEHIETTVDFNTMRRSIVEDFLAGRYHLAADKATTYYKLHKDDLSLAEQAQMVSLAIKTNTEISNFVLANTLKDEALTLIKGKNDLIAESFILNSVAHLLMKQERIEEAISILIEAARNAFTQPQELRLLTLSNIALLLQKTNPEKAKPYIEAARRLSANLNYREFAEDVFLAIKKKI